MRLNGNLWPCRAFAHALFCSVSPVPAAMPLHQYPPVPLASSCKQVTASWCPRSVRSGVSRLMRWLVKS